MKRVLRLTAYTPGSVQYADPSDIRNQFTVKSRVAPKAVGSSTASNHRGELIMNRTVPIMDTDCADPSKVVCLGDEVLSVRIVVSGSTKNSELIADLFENAVNNARVAFAKDFLKGFMPSLDTSYEIGKD